MLATKVAAIEKIEMEMIVMEKREEEEADKEGDGEDAGGDEGCRKRR